MQATEKKLFIVLGFGGVIAPARIAWNLPKDHMPEIIEYLDVPILRNLEKFCKEIGAQVVMMSSWNEKLSSASDWEALFASAGVSLPVAHVLPPAADTWFGARDVLREEHPDAEWFCFCDGTRPPPGEYRVALMDPMVGISPLDLLTAAKVLAPGSQTEKDLKSLTDTFDPNFRLSRQRF